jgi:hypothetical protein
MRVPVVSCHAVESYGRPSWMASRRFGCTYPARGRAHILYNCATAMDDDRIMRVQWLYRNDTEAECSTQELIDWDAQITAEDKDILEATDHDACIDTSRRVEFHMASDKPGLGIRKQLLALLRAHGEEAVYRGSPQALRAIPIVSTP